MFSKKLKKNNNLFSPDAAEFNPDSEAEIIARTLRAESHIIGWFYLTIGMFISVVVMFTFRCYSRFSYEQSNYIQRLVHFMVRSRFFGSLEYILTLLGVSVILSQTTVNIFTLY